jgi:hypothetical protein
VQSSLVVVRHADLGNADYLSVVCAAAAAAAAAV